MFVRKKKNPSGKISIQIIDKVRGKNKLIKTIGSSSNPTEIENLYEQGKQFIKQKRGIVELDFNNYNQLFTQVFSSISSLKLVGIDLVLGRIFEEIGFNSIEDELFRDLVLYRLVYPKSKLKTAEYLYRYSQKMYSEDDIYRYMDKLYNHQKDLVQQISYEHTLKVLSEGVHVVFYDVTTIYFETDKEDELRKCGFSKEGKHQSPQIVLGLLVSKGGYPLAYDIYDGKKFEGHTLMPIIEGFKQKYKLEDIVVVADSGLLSNENIKELTSKQYQFILGARIKNEKQYIKESILSLNLEDGQSTVIEKEDLKLIIRVC
jgi:transposase